MNRSPHVLQRLGVQLGFAVAVMTVVVFGITVWMVAGHERETLTRELTKRLVSESRSLSLAASSPLLTRDPELGLHPLIARALAETPELVDLVVLDTQRRVQGHMDMERVGTTLQAAPQREALQHGTLIDGSAWLVDGDLVIERPIRHLDRHVGWLVMRASRADIDAAVTAAQQRLLLLGSVGTLLSLLAVGLLVRMNLRPLDVLRRGVERIGAGDLKTRVHVSTRNELGMFASLLNRMATGLEKAQVKLIQKERLDQELEIARSLQTMLIPSEVQPAPGYRFESHYTPALEVSGDYYDVFPLDGNHLALTTADVSGKGVPGLVLMAMLRTALRSLARPDQDPVEAVVAASRMLRDSMGRGMFITCLYGILDAREHTFDYVSAGHCPPLAFGPRGVQALPIGGKPIGPFPDDVLRRSLRRHRILLSPGDHLLLYTDGLVESMNASGTPLGLDAVLHELETWRRSPSGSIIQQLVRRVERHRGERPESDDLTMVTVQRIGAPVRGESEAFA